MQFEDVILKLGFVELEKMYIFPGKRSKIVSLERKCMQRI